MYINAKIIDFPLSPYGGVKSAPPTQGITKEKSNATFYFGSNLEIAEILSFPLKLSKTFWLPS